MLSMDAADLLRVMQSDSQKKKKELLKAKPHAGFESWDTNFYTCF